jgi:hypothetical protein
VRQIRKWNLLREQRAGVMGDAAVLVGGEDADADGIAGLEMTGA